MFPHVALYFVALSQIRFATYESLVFIDNLECLQWQQVPHGMGTVSLQCHAGDVRAWHD